MTAVLGTHVDDRRRAAAGRRNRSGSEVVRGKHIVAPGIDVSMHIDAAWHDIAVGRVYLSRGTVKRAPNLLDFFIFNANVSLHHPGCSDYASIPDDHVHGRLSQL